MSESPNNISKSKAKRLAQENARKQQRTKKRLAVFWAILIPVAVVALIAGIVLYYKSTILDYSRYLREDGTVDVNINDYVTTSYQNMSFSKADLIPSDEQIDDEIERTLELHATLESDSSLTVKDGDKVNVCYDAYTEGILYDSVSANDGGYDMVIGNASLDAAVDTALAGLHPGDSVDVDITGSSADASGNEVVVVTTYSITVNGIYVNPEFDDAFVAENFPEYTSAENYRQSLIDGHYDTNLENAIRDSISLNCVISSVPEGYLNNTKKIIEKNNKDSFAYYSALYAQYGLNMGSIYEMYGFTSEAEYDNFVTEQAITQARFVMACQAIYADAGLTNTKEDVLNYYTELGVDYTTYTENLNTYGLGYMACEAMTGKVIEYLKGVVTITE